MIDPLPTMKGVPFAPRETVRIALAGSGGRGRGIFREMLVAEGVVAVAVYDVAEASVRAAEKMVADLGREAPAVYQGGRDEYLRLLDRGDIDLVLIASPWEHHVPMAVAAMEHGVHAAVEVPAAVTLDECWQLVDTSEKTRRHCIQLENCCYGYEELMMLNMTRAGLFGTLTHGEAAYIHDLRSLLMAEYSEGLWRRRPHTERNGNFYPTHGLGPIARCMGIHAGDRFTRLVSMSSQEASLAEYRDAHVGADDPKRAETYVCGDMNTSILKTALGRTIVLQHDVVTPRPYSRNTLLQGTKGAFRDWPAGVYIDGQEKHAWQPLDDFKAEYEHPLWTNVGELARQLGGHGGMDFLMLYRLAQCLREGLPPEMDVYDAAAWSAPGPLSEISVARDSAPVDFPDFTRGRWK